MPIKDRQENRDYQREWTRRKRLGLPTKIKERETLTEEERRKRRREYNTKYRAGKREEADQIFGTKCYICQGERKIVLHEKNGIKHPCDCTARIAIKKRNDYVRLCTGCHKAVHWCMNYFGMTWVDIIQHIREKPRGGGSIPSSPIQLHVAQ